MPRTHSLVQRWTDRRLVLQDARLRLLLVDDNRNGVEALAALLAQEDLDCKIALSGREAIESSRVWVPHIIVMDISMPECNGVQAARAIRQRMPDQEIAIIAFTALDETDLKRQASHRDFDAYCQKGFATTHLLRLITSFID